MNRFTCPKCKCHQLTLINMAPTSTYIIGFSDDWTPSYDLNPRPGLTKSHFACADCGIRIANNSEELKEFLKLSAEPQGIKLYILDEGNPDTVIPVVTDQPQNIRYDVGNEDHGGMEWEDFSRVCSKAEIKQIKSVKDLPPKLLFCYPYGGGNVGGGGSFTTCGELIKLMDENGIINPEFLE